ncbi:MAG: DUF89 family protein, partial [Candidatus Omnitrophica bacterium]|nr:DUF89 family protein [Candidatus Omnitrophota bacterium]
GNIKETLRYLTKEYGLDLIFREGGIGKIEPGLLKFFKDESLNLKLLDHLAKDGVVGGTELFLMEDEWQGSVFGLEKPELYRENLKAFREVIKKKRGSDRFLQTIKSGILTESSHFLDKKLRAFFHEWLFFQDVPTELMRHLETLKTYASKELKIDLTNPREQLDWPQLVRIFKLKELEAKRNQTLEKAEREKLLQWMQEKGIPKEYLQGIASASLGSLPRNDTPERTALSATVIARPAGPKQSPRNFLEHFHELAAPKGFSFQDYPHLSLAWGARVLQSEIKSQDLFKEINRLTEELLAHLSDTPEEKALISIYQDYLLLAKLFSLELVREEYLQIKERASNLNPSSLAKRLRELQAKGSKKKIRDIRRHCEGTKCPKQSQDQGLLRPTVGRPRNDAQIDLLFSNALSFYEMAEAREKVMFENMLSKMKELKQPNAILVTGGFHSEGLQQLLKENQFAYVEVAPHISQVTDSKTYLDAMMLDGNLLALRSQITPDGPVNKPMTTELATVILRDALETAREAVKSETFGNLPHEFWLASTSNGNLVPTLGGEFVSLDEGKTAVVVEGGKLVTRPISDLAVQTRAEVRGLTTLGVSELSRARLELVRLSRLVVGDDAKERIQLAIREIGSNKPDRAIEKIQEAMSGQSVEVQTELGEAARIIARAEVREQTESAHGIKNLLYGAASWGFQIVRRISSSLKSEDLKIVDSEIRKIRAARSPPELAKDYQPGYLLIQDAVGSGGDTKDGKTKQALEHLKLATQSFDPLDRFWKGERVKRLLEILRGHPEVGQLTLLQFEGIAHRLVKLHSGNSNAYQKYKEHLDFSFQRVFPQIREMVLVMSSFEEQLRAALIYSAIGNLMDLSHPDALAGLASELGVSIHNPLDLVETAFREIDSGKLVIGDDHLDQFIHLLEQNRGRKILYFVDNHGEIIMDQLVVEILLREGYSVTLVGKGEVVRDDVTKDEALDLMQRSDHLRGYMVNGKLKVVTDGSYLLGADLSQSGNQVEFLHAWKDAAAAIVKGAGSSHTLLEQKLSLPILLVRAVKGSKNAYKQIERVRKESVGYRPGLSKYLDMAFIFQPQAEEFSAPALPQIGAGSFGALPSGDTGSLSAATRAEMRAVPIDQAQFEAVISESLNKREVEALLKDAQFKLDQQFMVRLLKFYLKNGFSTFLDSGEGINTGEGVGLKEFFHVVFWFLEKQEGGEGSRQNFRFSGETLAWFAKVLDLYNVPENGHSLIPLSVPFLFSLALSGAVSAEDEPKLQERFRAVAQFPNKYKYRIVAFQLLQQGFHDPRGAGRDDYVTEEKIDLWIAEFLSEIALQGLEENIPDRLKQNLRRALARAWLSFIHDSPKIQALIKAHHPQKILRWLRKLDQEESNLEYSLSKMRTGLGTDIDNWGFGALLEDIFFSPSAHQINLKWMAEHAMARHGLREGGYKDVIKVIQNLERGRRAELRNNRDSSTADNNRSEATVFAPDSQSGRDARADAREAVPNGVPSFLPTAKRAELRGVRGNGSPWRRYLAAAYLGILSPFSSSFIRAEERAPYRFAPDYSAQDLLQGKGVTDEYIGKVMYWEGKFHQAGIAFNGKSGLTYDGHSIDFKTGELIGGPRNWSASSKESLHVIMLTLAIAGDARAQKFVNPDHPEEGAVTAVQILEHKITSYEKFNREYPGFGGFFPWFLVSDEGMKPTHDWQDRVPGLDNGELAWPLYAAYHVLEDQGHPDLAKRYKAHFDLMAENAVMIFYEGGGRIRAEAAIRDTSARPSPDNYSNQAAGYFLDDPYEGELMAFFMDLFGVWPNPDEREKVWIHKRGKLESVEFMTPKGPITVQKGHWFSAHEKWAYFVLPYQDVPIARRVLVSGEKARTWHSALKGIPGLFASVHGVVQGNENPPYISDLGIQAIARERVTRQDVVTPYASFPVILAGGPGIGLVWYDLMLDGPRMQGPHGSIESIDIKGTAIAPLLTWDAKITTDVALVGGITDETAAALKKDGRYQRFFDLVDREYSRAFPRLEGEDLPFAEPTAVIPMTLGDFQLVPKGIAGAEGAVDILKGTEFQGGGSLLQKHRIQNGELVLPASDGYVWNRIKRVDLEKQPVLNLTVQTNAEGPVMLEVKNTDDQLVTERKFALQVPNTGGKPRTFALDLSTIPIIAENKIAGIFVFSDPQVTLRVQSGTFTAKPAEGSEILKWDGRRFVRDLKEQPPQPPALKVDDILGKVNFQPGGGIRFKHEATLKLQRSGGWIWGHMPEQDLAERPYVVFDVNTTGGRVWLELKNKNDQAIVGKPRFNVMKVALNFPDTKGKKLPVAFDLSPHLIRGVGDQAARIIAFSDPEADFEISVIGFVTPDELKALGLKPRSELRGWYDQGKLGDEMEGSFRLISLLGTEVRESKREQQPYPPKVIELMKKTIAELEAEPLFQHVVDRGREVLMFVHALHPKHGSLVLVANEQTKFYPPSFVNQAKQLLPQAQDQPDRSLIQSQVKDFVIRIHLWGKLRAISEHLDRYPEEFTRHVARFMSNLENFPSSTSPSPPIKSAKEVIRIITLYESLNQLAQTRKENLRWIIPKAEEVAKSLRERSPLALDEAQKIIDFVRNWERAASAISFHETRNWIPESIIQKWEAYQDQLQTSPASYEGEASRFANGVGWLADLHLYIYYHPDSRPQTLITEAMRLAKELEENPTNPLAIRSAELLVSHSNRAEV